MSKTRFDLENEVARLVKSERNRLDLGQARMAVELGVDPTYISHLEAGRRLPSLDLLARLADLTGKELVVTLKERGR